MTMPAAASTYGSIAVDSTPQGCQIYLDGVSMGYATPYTLDNIASGSHIVAVTQYGYENAVRNVTVVSGTTTPVTFPLTTTQGSITVNSAPQGAYIQLDGSWIGYQTPATIPNIAAGSHIVKVYQYGYEDASQMVNVIAGADTPVTFPLTTTQGSISVDSTPQGADIQLDGGWIGQTPATISNIAAGSHIVRITKYGYEDASQVVKVTAGADTPVTFSLTTTQGSISVDSTPQGADIQLDGGWIGQTPATISNIAAGSHIVRVTKYGYEDASQVVKVTAGADTPVTFPLILQGPPITDRGSITVDTTPDYASVYIDGVYRGSSEQTFPGIAAGTHKVAVVMGGYESADKEVTVVAGSDTPVTFALTTTQGSISVDTTPDYAYVYIDGVYRGSSEQMFPGIAAGTHKVIVTMDGYGTQEKDVTVVAGANAPVSFTLTTTRGSISVDSAPTGATVLIDGISRSTWWWGYTPYTFSNIAAGEHKVAVLLDGYETQEKDITVVAGSETPVFFTLTANPGAITVDSAPSGASVYVDHVYRGTTPATIEKVATGSHTVKVEMWGYETQEKDITVVTGAVTPVSFTMVPTQGSITADSTPSGAYIYIDGGWNGYTTPATIKNIERGSHKVKVILAGYEPAEQDVTVVAEKDTPVSFTLTANPGSISVDSTPQGASIIIDGGYTGEVTPATLDKITVGSHTVQVTLDGYEIPASQIVDVVAGTAAPVTFSLIQQGSATVESTPPGAYIYIDGGWNGYTTPATIDHMSPGSHSVQVSLTGYQTPDARTVTVESGKDTPVSFTLVSLTEGSITVDSLPPGAAISLDGADTGKVTPATLDKVISGSHSIQVSLADYQPAYQTVTVEAGKVSPVSFTLMPMYGTITIGSTPPGATIWLNSADTGKVTPATLDKVPNGNNYVMVSLPGYQNAGQSVNVIGGADTPVNLVLTPSPGTITVDSTPEGGLVYLDGADTHKITPATLDQLTPGSHTVKVMLAGYAPAEQSVMVVSDMTIPVMFDLTANPGSITVNSVPSGATVYLDGALSGVTPVTLNHVTAGSHKVTAVLTGYETAEQDVTVVADKTTPVSFLLTAVIPKNGAISVTSVPEGATIYLDGAGTGKTTPATLDEISVGSHKVKVTLAGFEEPAVQDVTVMEGLTASVTFSLTEIPPTTGQLQVTSDPEGAEILINGVANGKLTNSLLEFTPGPVTVSVQKRCYISPKPQDVTIVEGRTVDAAFILTRDPACSTPAPEFPTFILPVVMLLGMVFVIHSIRQQRK